MRKFTDIENKVLQENYRHYSNGELAEYLDTGRNEKSVFDQLLRLKLRRTRKEYAPIRSRIMTTIKFYPDETKHLRENYYGQTNGQLLDHLNKHRSKKEQLAPTTMLNYCRKLGLSRGIQIRWSYSDTRRLKKWHPLIGDKYIAQLLNRVGCSRRKIDGKMVYKVFTRKHIEKKRELLRIKRTDAQLAMIRKDNIMCGEYTFWSEKNNPWNNGSRPKLNEEDTVIWKDQNGVRKRYIKIDGRAIPYRRWFYLSFMGPIPAGMTVHARDLDPLNDESDNLILREKELWTKEMIFDALPKLRKRLRKAQTEEKVNTEYSERKSLQLEVIRLVRLIDNYEERVQHKPPEEQYQEEELEIEIDIMR